MAPGLLTSIGETSGFGGLPCKGDLKVPAECTIHRYEDLRAPCLLPSIRVTSGLPVYYHG